MSQDLLDLLYSAAFADIGRKVQTESPEKLRNKLYRIRNNHPALANLALIISPENPERELWIVNKPPETPHDSAEE